ncbi:MAG TPA: lysophospholipid acyltransferase family protein [Anaerolineales bacterium]|nr:lysophospholipid acyltransferase family protein [Anaerolineales bacterium]
MSLSQTFVLKFLDILTSTICRIDDAQLAQVPDHGPLILITNHVNVLEIPVLYTRLRPRPISGFFAAKRLDSAWMRWFLKTLNGIPVQRGKLDRTALKRGISRIRAGDIFGIAPEGTRSADGRLGQGKPGVVLLAMQSEAPIQPVVHWGSAHWQRNLRRFRRTPFHFAVGRPFQLDTGGKRVDRRMRQQILDEIMAQMAALLPPQFRGVYANLGSTNPKYLRFL